MADGDNFTDWKSEYRKLQAQCQALDHSSGRHLGMFALGALVTGSLGAGLYYWKKRQGCACQIKPLKAQPVNGGSKNGNGNGGQTNGTGNGNGNGGQSNGGGGGMAPGDS